MGIKPAPGMIVIVAIVLSAVAPMVFAGQPPVAAKELQTDIAQDEENRRYFTDLNVITHEGKKLRFYSDLLKDKLVVISFFYINCPSPQPNLLTSFKLQRRLKDRLGQDVLLLTISVDPQNDTPEAIREYAAKYRPRKGWLFLTGSEKNMASINRKLGNTLRLPEGHLRQFLLGNLKTGHWMKLVETAPDTALVMGLHSLSEEN